MCPPQRPQCFHHIMNPKADTHECEVTYPRHKKKSIVYQVPCKDCDSVYTGESKLKVWLAEHKCAVTESDPNGTAVHVRSREGAQH